MRLSRQNWVMKVAVDSTSSRSRSIPAAWAPSASAVKSVVPPPASGSKTRRLRQGVSAKLLANFAMLQRKSVKSSLVLPL